MGYSRTLLLVTLRIAHLSASSQAEAASGTLQHEGRYRINPTPPTSSHLLREQELTGSFTGSLGLGESTQAVNPGYAVLVDTGRSLYGFHAADCTAHAA
jgi:hypothetical protein